LLDEEISNTEKLIELWEQKLELLLEDSNSKPLPGYGTNFGDDTQMDYYFDLQSQPFYSWELEQ
jgi:hypothetical protein